MAKNNKKPKIKAVKTEKIEIDVLKARFNADGSLEVKEGFESDEIVGGKRDDTVVTHWPTAGKQTF